MIQGNFYFKLTENGNLIGEFINNGTKEFNVECANKDGNENINFVGKFISTWLEKENVFTSKLTITNDEDKKGYYKLVWISNGKKTFYGNGFVTDNILYGDYSSSYE